MIVDTAPDGSRPLLTIAIPTYNRARDLARLLRALVIELQGLHHLVSVVIADNASTDNTAEVIARFRSDLPHARVILQPTNLGMDGNFCACALAAVGDYFWMMGDDDLPTRGSIVRLLELLERERPDLVWLNARWMPDVEVEADSTINGPLEYVRLSRDDFCRRVHVWSTFLTGMLVRRSALLDDDAAVRRFSGTHLAQMSWIMDWLRNGRSFLHVHTPCVLATAGASGGYAVVTVFGEHFPRIVRESLNRSPRDRALSRAIILRTVVCYLPGLLWDLRHARSGDFRPENIAAALRPQLGRHPVTSLVLLPVSHLPRPAARIVLKLAGALARALGLIDRLRTCLPRST